MYCKSNTIYLVRLCLLYLKDFSSAYTVRIYFFGAPLSFQSVVRIWSFCLRVCCDFPFGAPATGFSLPTKFSNPSPAHPILSLSQIHHPTMKL